MNVANALMAAESARVLGLSDADIVEGLASAPAVPGRMQTVMASSNADMRARPRPTVVVDYSHTPDSIRTRARDPASGSPGRPAVHRVSGVAGTETSRSGPLMGRAAELGADRVYVTSDNPRSEDPIRIIEGRSRRVRIARTRNRRA